MEIKREVNLILNSKVTDSELSSQNEKLKLAIQKLELEYDKVVNAANELKTVNKSLSDDIEYRTERVAELNQEVERLKDGTAFEEQARRVEALDEVLRRAAKDFRSFMSANGFDSDYSYQNIDGWLESLDERIQRVRDGSETYQEAVMRFKADFGHLMEGQGGGNNSDVIRELLSLKESMSSVLESITELLTVVNKIDTEGVKAATVVNETATEAQEASAAIKALGEASEGSQESASKLVAALAEFSKDVDIAKLVTLSDVFKSIASVSSVGMGEKTIANLVTLISQLKSISSGDALKLNFDFSNLQDLKIRKTSLANLADYLPKISKDVDVAKLEALSHVHFDNFADLKVSKSSMEGLQNVANAMQEIQSTMAGFGGGGGSGGNGGGGGASGGAFGTFENGVDRIIRKFDAENKEIRRTIVATDALGVETRKYMKLNEAGDALEVEKTQKTIDYKKQRVAAEKEANEAIKAQLHDLNEEEKRIRREEADAAREGTERQKATYKELMVYIRTFYRDRLALARGAAKDGSLVLGADGSASYSGTSTEFNALIDSYDTVRAKLAQMGLSLEDLTQKENLAFGPDAEAEAKRLGISVQQYRDLVIDVGGRIADLGKKTEASEAATERAWQKNAAKAHDYYERIREVISKNPEVAKLGEELNRLATNGSPKDLNELTSKMAEFQAAIRASGADVEAWFQKMKKSFGSRMRSMVSGMLIGYVMRYVRQFYTNVKELDSALTQMQIVTGKTDKTINEFADTMAKSAQKVGASITDLVNSATTFARLGYSMEEAGKFAELAAEYSKVANTDVNSATTSITTVVKAFGVQADELEGVLDKLMYIGEHFPVSAEELGTGFQNAGSALKAAGNTIDQSIALLTAANAQIQDISRASTGLRTIAARMTRSEADLEALGESIEDIVSTPKLQEFMRAFGVEILDARGELRSTYDILLDLSKVWDDLSSTQRASIAEKLAGTRQQNVFFGLVDSMKTEAVGVMSTISEASGTLEAANQVRLDSIQGRVDQLNASFQELSKTLLNSGLVKGFFDFANGVVQLLNSAGGIAGGILVYIPIIITGLTTIVGLLQKMNFIGGLKAMWNWLQKTANGMRYLGYYTREANVAIDKQTLSTEELTAAQNRQAEAASTAKAGMAGWIAVIVAAIAVTATIVKKINEQIEANRQRVQEEAKAAKESADAAKAELEALEELQKELEKAKGDREALAAVYDKLSEKIDVNTRNIYSETDAYEAHLVALKTEIEYQRELTEVKNEEAREAARRAIEEKRLERSVPGIFASILPESLIADSSAADMRALLRSSNTLTSKQKADIIKNFVAQQADTMMGTAGTTDSGGFGAAWSANGPQNQGQNKVDYSDVLNAVDYKFINELKRLGEKNARKEYGITYEEVLGYLGYSAESYEKFFSELSTAVQDYLAKSVEKIVNQGNTGFGEAFFNQIIGRLVSEDAATTEEIEDVIKLLTDNSSGVGQSLSAYYAVISDAANHTQAEVDEAYKSLMGNVERLKWEVRTQSDEFWPVILEEINKFVGSIERVSVSIDYTSVELKSILDILNEVQPGFDAISTAMNDMAENGNLSASSLEGLMKIEGDLKEVGFDVNSVIERTAEGYKLADDALEKFIRSNITYYGTIGSNESKEGRENALQNLQKYRAVLLTLLREVEESDKKSGYNRRKDKLKDQLDEYKKLIDLRKKLLETYEDELKYQRELSQRQNALASLQAQLSLAELDQSAAGRARARELRAQVQDAQNDLDDFTLEHAIEVVTNNLDDQYSEYETFINDKLDRLEKAIKGVEDAVNNRIDADTLRELLGLIDEKINNIAPPGMNDYRYIALQNNGVAVKNAAEFDLDLDLRKRYKTWEKYINALYIRMMGNSKVAGLLGIEEHHSGGFVGGVKSNETFAKLMDGEFVVTPNQMSAFVNRTLPTISGGGTTNINSPLVAIECDNVSQDALPGLKTIVNDAVEEIKRQFDGGMTRAANYSTNRKKLYI